MAGVVAPLDSTNYGSAFLRKIFTLCKIEKNNGLHSNKLKNVVSNRKKMVSKIKKGVKQKKEKKALDIKNGCQTEKNNKKKNAPLKLPSTSPVCRYRASWLVCCPRMRRCRSSSSCCWSHWRLFCSCFVLCVLAVVCCAFAIESRVGLGWVIIFRIF